MFLLPNLAKKYKDCATALASINAETIAAGKAIHTDAYVLLANVKDYIYHGGLCHISVWFFCPRESLNFLGDETRSARHCAGRHFMIIEIQMRRTNVCVAV